MGMVTLVQRQQIIPVGGNRCQKDQDQASGDIAIENHDIENCRGEIALKEIAVTVAGNVSLAGSSTQCSDVDDDEEETDIEEGEWIPELPVPAVLQHHQQVATADGNVVLPNADTSNFGDVRVKNSANVHLGNKTFYKGPVTIKQFVYTNPTSIQEYDTVKSDGGQASDANASDLSTAKGDLPGNPPNLYQNTDLDKGDYLKYIFQYGVIDVDRRVKILRGPVNATPSGGKVRYVLGRMGDVQRGSCLLVIETKITVTWKRYSVVGIHVQSSAYTLTRDNSPCLTSSRLMCRYRQ